MRHLSCFRALAIGLLIGLAACGPPARKTMPPAPTAPPLLVSFHWDLSDPLQFTGQEHLQEGRLVMDPGAEYAATVTLPFRAAGTHAWIQRVSARVVCDRPSDSLCYVLAVIGRNGQDSAHLTLVLRDTLPAEQGLHVLTATGEWNMPTLAGRLVHGYLRDPRKRERTVSDLRVSLYGRRLQERPMYVTSFEADDGFDLHGSVETGNAHSGTHLLALSRADEFGPGVITTASAVKGMLTSVRCGVWLFSRSRDPGLLLTMSIDRPDSGQVAWRGKELWAKEFTSGEWQHFTAEFLLRDVRTKPTDKVHVMVWNKHHASVLLDDMAVVLQGSDHEEGAALDNDSLRDPASAWRQGLPEQLGYEVAPLPLNGAPSEALRGSLRALVPLGAGTSSVVLVTDSALVRLSIVDHELTNAHTFTLAPLIGGAIVAATGDPQRITLVAGNGTVWQYRIPSGDGWAMPTKADLLGPYRFGAVPGVAPRMVMGEGAGPGRVLLLDTLNGRYLVLGSDGPCADGAIDPAHYDLGGMRPDLNKGGLVMRVASTGGAPAMQWDLSAPACAPVEGGDASDRTVAPAPHHAQWVRWGGPGNTVLACGPGLARPELWSERDGHLVRTHVLEPSTMAVFNSTTYAPEQAVCTMAQGVLWTGHDPGRSVRFFLVH